MYVIVFLISASNASRFNDPVCHRNYNGISVSIFFFFLRLFGSHIYKGIDIYFTILFLVVALFLDQYLFGGDFVVVV